MAVQNYVTPTGKLVVTGEPPRIREKNLGTVANGYPGRLVVREDTDFDIKVSDAKLPPIGFLGYPGEFEGTDLQYTVGDINTINVVDSVLPVYSGGGFTIYMPSGLALGTKAVEGDILLSWENGQVVPGVCMGGRYAVKIPFASASGTTLKDTGFDVPGGLLIRECILNVTTNTTGASVDVGFKNAVESGDEDGLLNDASCATAGLVFASRCDVDAAGADTITSGALLQEVLLTDATSSPNAYTYSVPVPYLTNGTAKSLTYTPTDHAVGGDIYLFIESPGVVPVGRAGAAADASSAACGIFVEATL
jgi:hypothetical protein